MTSTSTHRLIQLVCDERADAAQCSELERRVLSDAAARRAYVEAMNVHAALIWDQIEQDDVQPGRQPRRRTWVASLASLAAAVLVGVGLWVAMGSQGGDGPIIAANEQADSTVTEPAGTSPAPTRDGENAADDLGSTSQTLAAADGMPKPAQEDYASDEPLLTDLEPIAVAQPSGTQPIAAADDSVVSADQADTAGRATGRGEYRETIDTAIASRLIEEELEPSPVAEPGEWLRRASLDIRGRIPSRDEIDAFLAADPATRRAAFIEQATESRDFADHFGTRWSTLLVGRSPDRQRYRQRLRGWIADEIAGDAPWSDIAGQLIAASGTEENPPTNFLLAHLNSQAVPATAITSRVLLGRQVQCTQCHKHPWTSQGQDEFWQLNAFFKQTEIRQRRDGVEMVRELVDVETGGPTYYEDLRGVMQVAYPRWNGHELPRQADVPRRQELARLLADESDRTLAEAMASRVWEMMIGYPLTPRVDDLGPHAAVSHPVVLDTLTDAFLASGYDVPSLVRLVASTDLYQRSSTATPRNDRDRPEDGSPAMLSRVYVKPLSAEQIYDSIVVAARGTRGRSDGLPDRDEWTSRFYQAQQNEENGDLSTFDGSVNQALAMMNGELVAAATQPAQAEALDEAISRPETSTEKLAAVLELALGRPASEAEQAALARLLKPAVRRYAQHMPGPQAAEEGLRDVFWACLNSSRFALNY